MTPTPAPDEPIDPAVRSLLWRLRARLVIPPDQTRTSADLDRLFAAAREHAHGDAPAPEVIRIIPSVTAGDDDGHAVTGTGVGDPFAVDQGDGAPVPAEVSSLAARRYRVTTMVSRVAAAVVLVVAVGGGFASARDGNGLIIQALLGRGASEPAEPDTLAGGSAGDVADEFDLDTADLPEPRGVPLTGDDSAEAADDPDEDATTPPADVGAGGGNAAVDDAPADTDTGGSNAAEGDDDADDGADGADTPADTPAEAPTDEIAPAPAPAPAPVEPAPVEPAPVEPAEPPSTPEAPVDEVVAPPPSEVVGTGGPTPCREDEDLATCFERRTAEQEAATEEAPAEDTDGPDVTDEPTDEPTDDAAVTDEDAAAKEALAKRRGS